MQMAKVLSESQEATVKTSLVRLFLATDVTGTPEEHTA